MNSLGDFISNRFWRNNLQSCSHLKYATIKLVIRLNVNRELCILTI